MAGVAMKTILTLTFSIWIILKFIIAGAFIQKWKMQSIFNYHNLPRIAPLHEVQTMGMYLFLGVASLFIITIKIKEILEDE